eukprot:1044260-Pyramimonas_sp.AAC.1
MPECNEKDCAQHVEERNAHDVVRFFSETLLPIGALFTAVHLSRVQGMHARLVIRVPPRAVRPLRRPKRRGEGRSTDQRACEFWHGQATPPLLMEAPTTAMSRVRVQSSGVCAAGARRPSSLPPPSSSLPPPIPPPRPTPPATRPALASRLRRSRFPPARALRARSTRLRASNRCTPFPRCPRRLQCLLSFPASRRRCESLCPSTRCTPAAATAGRTSSGADSSPSWESLAR